MDEVIQAIIEASKQENAGALIGSLLERERKAAVDHSKGVDDVTGELRRALERQKARVEELRPYADLGEVDEVKKRLQELDRLKREMESKEHGVDDAKVQELAQKRAERMSQQAVTDAKAEADAIKAKWEETQAERDHLVECLEVAWLDLDIHKNGGDKVSSLFYPLLRDNARPYYSIPQNGEEPWWKAKPGTPPRFTVVDPEDRKTPLIGKKGPKTTAELLEEKKVGEWADFWPRTDRGPGGQSGEATLKGTLSADASGLEMLESVLGSTS